MPTLEVTYQTEAERLAFQRAIDYTAEMLRLAQGCPDEQVVEACEGLALEKGRQLLRDSLGDSRSRQQRGDALRLARSRSGLEPREQGVGELLVCPRSDRMVGACQLRSNAMHELILGARALYLGFSEYHDCLVLLDPGMELPGFVHARLHAS